MGLSLWVCWGSAVSAGHPGLEPCLVPSALCSLGPRRGSTAVPHTPPSPDSGPGDPREGSDLHEGFLSALPGGERVRKALYRPLTCGLKIRPWGISTMAWTPPLLTLLTLCPGDWLWEGGGLLRVTPGYFLPLFENSLWTITRDTPVRVCAALALGPGPSLHGNRKQKVTPLPWKQRGCWSTLRGLVATDAS